MKLSKNSRASSVFAIAVYTGLVTPLLVSCGTKHDREEHFGQIRSILPPSTVSAFHHWRSGECWETQVWWLGRDWPAVPGTVISLPGCLGSNDFRELIETTELTASNHEPGRIEARLRRSHAKIAVYSQDLFALNLDHYSALKWSSSNTLQPGDVHFECSYRFEPIAVTNLEISLISEFGQLHWDYLIDCSGEANSYSMSKGRLLVFLSEARGFEGFYTDFRPSRGLTLSSPVEARTSEPLKFDALVLLERIDSFVK